AVAGSTDAVAGSPDDAPATAETAAGNGALIARGAEVYGAECASCHGDAGQGKGKAPPVVGQGALPRDPRPGQKRKVAFRTAGDVLAWYSANMPPTDPGNLPAEDYLAILAFDLDANGVDLGAEPLTAERAAAIVLHE
ncbi:MAG TPA: cytochrome c, partial [Kofleriaceae bacterium]|nr:cytochrome c [Kofleriaceae bacterium]